MKKIKLAEDILVQNIDNEAVIVSPKEGMITTINETVAFLIQYLKDHNDVTQKKLINVLSEEYNAPEEIMTKDVELFIEEMAQNKIIV